MSNVTSIANAVSPEWLDGFVICPWCSAGMDLAYDPRSPLAASFRCPKCGMAGTVSPPFECMDRGAVNAALRGIEL